MRDARDRRATARGQRRDRSTIGTHSCRCDPRTVRNPHTQHARGRDQQTCGRRACSAYSGSLPKTWASGRSPSTARRDELRDDDEEIEDAHVHAHLRVPAALSGEQRVGQRQYRGPGEADADHRQRQPVPDRGRAYMTDTVPGRPSARLTRWRTRRPRRRAISGISSAASAAKPL